MGSTLSPHLALMATAEQQDRGSGVFWAAYKARMESPESCRRNRDPLLRDAPLLSSKKQELLVRSSGRES